MGREGWNRLLAAAEAKLVVGVMFWDLSRFSRDFFDGIADVGRLRSLGVQIADTKMGIIDLNSQAGQIYVAVGLSGAQQETKGLGERSKRGLRFKVVRDHGSSGGIPAFGLQRVPVFSDTELDPDGRPRRLKVSLAPHPVLSLIFELYDAGLSKHAIAAKLNADGVPTRDAGRSRCDRYRRPILNSGTWSASSVKSILENTVYVGVRIWNKESRTGNKLPGGKKQQKKNPEDQWETVPGFCEPIIDENLWNRVQLRLKADAAKYKKNHISNQHGQFLLSGLIRCACCGASFVIGTRRKGVRHYRCGFRSSRGHVVCTNTVTVPQPALEGRVRDVLNVVVKDPKKLAGLVAEHNRRISTANAAQLAVVRSLEAQSQKLAAERDRLVEAISYGTGAVKVLVGEVEKREKDIQELTTRIREAETLVQPLLIPRPPAVEDYLVGPASLFDDDFTRNKQLMERVLEGIFVHADGTISLRFRESSLFAPVTSFDLKTRAEQPVSQQLAATRKLHRELLENGLAQFDDCKQKPKTVQVEQAYGLPFYRFDSPAKKTLASPEGVEPSLAT